MKYVSVIQVCNGIKVEVQLNVNSISDIRYVASSGVYHVNTWGSSMDITPESAKKIYEIIGCKPTGQ